MNITTACFEKRYDTQDGTGFTVVLQYDHDQGTSDIYIRWPDGRITPPVTIDNNADIQVPGSYVKLKWTSPSDTRAVTAWMDRYGHDQQRRLGFRD